MLPGHRRLRSGAQFRAVARTGVRASAGSVVVQVCPADPSGPDAAVAAARPSRVGFVVGRAVGGAVVRNRVTRRLRHLMASRLETLPTGLDIVVRATPQAAGADSARLGRELDSALGRCLTRLGQRSGTVAGVAP